jgi:protein-S-isoprenylcysteine O-methyltransferase Ste14
MFAFGVVCHAMFLVVFLYMALFVGGILVPKTIDTPTDDGVPMALLIDVGLLALFALPHSVMARPGFKQWWTQFVPKPLERSVYVLLANVTMILLMWQWRPINVMVWDFHGPVGRALMWTIFAAGWLLVPLASLMINHFDLFGTRQVWLHLRGRADTPQPFRTPMLYARMRHPLYVGWAIAFWAAPTMTLGHLLFAAVLTIYMFVAARFFEERDLVAHFGDTYRDYQRRVPMFVPRLGNRGHGVEEASDKIPAATAPAYSEAVAG